MKDLPRLTIVLDSVPDPVDRGEKFRTRKVLEALVDRYDVGLVCLERGGDNSAHDLASRLGFRLEWSRRVSRRREVLVRLLGMATPLPCRLFILKQVGLHAAALQAASRSELVLLETPYAYTGQLRRFGVVNDLHGIESEYYRTLAESVRDVRYGIYYRWEHRKLLRHEAAVWNGAAGNIFLSHHDEQCARSLGYLGGSASTIIPQGIDFPDRACLDAEGGCESDLFFCGNLSQPRNVDPLVTFIGLIRSGLRKGEIPSTFRFRIAGKGAPERLLALCDGQNFEYLGFLPSLDAHLRSTRAIFCYLPGGSGVKTKIVEAFGYGKPVICDNLSASALPELFALSGVRAATSYEDAYHCLLRVLKGDGIGTDIHAYVRENYSWQALMQRFVRFLESVRVAQGTPLARRGA